jgi:hypothetical protein
MADEPTDSKLTRAVWLVAIMAAGAVLYFAQDVLIPVAMALFRTAAPPAVDRYGAAGTLRRGTSGHLVMIVVCASVALPSSPWKPAPSGCTRAADVSRDRSGCGRFARCSRAWTRSPSGPAALLGFASAVSGAPRHVSR